MCDIEKQDNLLTSSDVSDILKVSRERVRQLVNEKVLPPKYIFNKNSKRKQHVFDKETVEEYLKKGKVDWIETEELDLLSIPEINNFLDCSNRWIYDMTRSGQLTPSMIVGGTNRKVYLYDIMSVLTAFINKNKRGSEKGHKKNTLKLISDIKSLHKEGLNDSEIANKLDKKQPFIAKLRKEMGLVSNCSRGRPRAATNKTIVNPTDKEIPF